MSPVEESKLKEHIIKLMYECEKCIKSTNEEKDDEIKAYFMGKQTALAQIITIINDI